MTATYPVYAGDTGKPVDELAALRERHGEQLSPEWFEAHHATNETLANAARPKIEQDLGPRDVDRKAFATAQARAALVGFELVDMPGGGFVSSKWGHIRALATMGEVDAFLRQIGA